MEAGGVSTVIRATAGPSTRGVGAASRSADDSRRIVVASVPANHVYVQHISTETGEGPVRLPDPTPSGGAAAPQRWWPPVMLEPGWVEKHDFDVFHLHFGFDARSVAELLSLIHI